MKRGEGIEGSPNSTGIVIAPSAVIMEERVDPLKGGPAGTGGGMSADGEARLLELMEEQNKLIKNQNKILKGILEK